MTQISTQSVATRRTSSRLATTTKSSRKSAQSNSESSSSDDSSAIEEFPFFASIYRTNGDYKCAGSIIFPQIILTSARCLKGLRKNEITVKVSASNYKVKKIWKHEDYKEPGLKNNVGILTLVEDIEFNIHAQPIGLPTSSLLRNGTLGTVRK